MYKLSINASNKSDADAAFRDAHTWWKNISSGTGFSTVKMNNILKKHNGRYRGYQIGISDSWCIEFDTEEDAAIFILRYS